MEIVEKFDFIGKKEIQWKGVIVETSRDELKSIFNNDDTIIDYDSLIEIYGAPFNYKRFGEHIKTSLFVCAEDIMIDEVGPEEFEFLKQYTNHEHDNRYKDLLNSSTEKAWKDKLYVIFMCTKNFEKFSDDSDDNIALHEPFVRMVISNYGSGVNLKEKIIKAYQSTSKHENIKPLEAYNIHLIERSFTPFDIFIDGIKSHIDTSYLKSAFVDSE